jgi:hypothetical protein
MAVRLQSLRAYFPVPSGRFLLIISLIGSVELRAILPLEGIRQLKTL